MRFLVGLLAAVALVTAGCGTDGPARVSANTDASALLRSTFQNLPQIKSAAVDLKVSAGDGSASLTGPFAVSEKKGELPRFNFAATLKSGSRTESAGAAWTGEQGYATLDGVSYEIPGLFVQQLAAGFEQASPLAAVDASKWVSNPVNAGFADVGGVQTVKVAGGADTRALLADLEKLSASLGALNAFGKQLNFKLSEHDKAEAVDSVKDAQVEVYTGADDSLLRRLVVSATIDGDPVVVDLTLTQVGEDLSIDGPKSARPFSELMQKFQAAGGPDILQIK
jgi:hypothetical protein